MSDVISVVGALYGDEGKGLMTDYFASKNPDASIVVRHNGSCQAGHSVQTPEGQRHVFSHFGSGSFLRVPTYLSSHFVCNPLLYGKEKVLLNAMGVTPKTMVHPESLVTTPYDAIINLILEARRGDDRHGSVGVGFGETIARSAAFEKITVSDLGKPNLRDKLIRIREEYVPHRFKDQPIDRNTNSDAVWHDILRSDALIDDWIDAAQRFTCDVIPMIDEHLTHKHIIFEGAQGLMLDQQSPDFPHVTRSNTGTTNVMHILNNIKNVNSLNVVYVSRAYSTRHGAGPLDFEQDLPYNIIDETNVPNINQGSLRFAPLLLDTISKMTLQDFSNIDKKYNPIVNMAFTCLDQITEQGLFVAGGSLTKYDRDDYLNMLEDIATYVSYGPTRKNITLSKL